MRWFVRGGLPFVLAVVAAPFVSAGPEVTEAEAVRTFLDQSPHARRIPLIERSVDAERRAVALVENPGATFEIEDVGPARETTVALEQALPAGGRRRLLTDAATCATRAAVLAAEHDLRRDVHELRRAFFDVVYRERARELIGAGRSRVERTRDVLARREAEGEAAGYDVLRAEQELAGLESASRRAEADLVSARARFAAYFEPGSRPASATPVGELRPSGALPEPERALARAARSRSDLQALHERGRCFELERRAEQRRRIPEPVLTAGWKRAEEGGASDSGYVAGLSFRLPVFDRGRLGTARAAAEHGRAALDAEILTRRIQAEVHGALARERAARETARRFDDTVESRAAELERIAQLRYDEGESGILELLDAHRTALATRLDTLAAHHEAKLAEIDRQAAIGEEVTP